MNRDKIKLSCWNVMGVPSTKAECLECKVEQSYFGVQTYSRAEKWGEEHVCGVKVEVPRAGFLMPGEEQKT